MMCMKSTAEIVTLLSDMVELWITVRGFSNTSCTVDQYKLCTSTTLQRNHALRKNLKSSKTALID